MRVSRLIPIVVLGAILFHAGPALKQRAGGALGARDKVVVKQRINIVAEALVMESISGGELPATQEEFRAFVKKRVRSRANAKEDASRDSWGTSLRYSNDDPVITVISAGPDKAFGTKDDVKVSKNVGEL